MATDSEDTYRRKHAATEDVTTDSADAGKDAMLRAIDWELAEITRLAASRRSLGASDPSLDALERCLEPLTVSAATR